jgi:propionyl-CoA carboxylase alpha chain
MIAKLCTHGPSRNVAIKAMERALDQYVVRGLSNNITFCRDVMRNEKFRTGDYNTKFIGEEYPNGFTGVVLTDTESKELVAITSAMHLVRSIRSTDDVEGFVVVLPPVSGVKDASGRPYFVSVSHDEDVLSVFMTPYKKGLSSEAHLQQQEKSVVRISNFEWIDGAPLGRIHFKDAEDASFVQYELREQELSSYMLPPAVTDTSRFLLCPMPGTLISISVVPGQKVEAGQQLAVVEAMKMQVHTYNTHIQYAHTQ